MKSARTLAAVLAWTVIITGCQRRKAPVIPAAATAPPPPTSTIEQASAPLPAMPPPATPAVVPPTEQDTKLTQKPKHPIHHHKATPGSADTTSKDQLAKDAAMPPAPDAEAPPASPIGQITTTGDSVTTPSEPQIRNTIAATERGLGDLKRSLSPSEKETVVQIRAFLQKARQALKQNDLEGAQTLSTKAKVLLGELTHS